MPIPLCFQRRHKIFEVNGSRQTDTPTAQNQPESRIASKSSSGSDHLITAEKKSYYNYTQ